ncbi:MAG TPA: hypothetical protein VF629_03975 [Hymenobacter sp.]|jgi:hypothetical protein|uniref:hypothetical protein n=1 Tax=Hymenobacter sp. TaxID=1898978 RepID=UPI002ED9B422
MIKQFLAFCLLSGAAAAQVRPKPAAPPCPYRYPAASRPACVGGHTDRLIPILYGLPSPQMMEQSRQGKVRLGGCEITGCDPRYYCPIHKKDL